MVELLAQIKERSEQDDPFVGRAALRQLEGNLAELPKEATLDRLQLEVEMAVMETRLGHTEKGITVLEGAFQQASKPGSRFPAEAVREIGFQLGVAYLRQGEDENCLAGHNSESCLFPIQGEGLHKKTEGSQQAARVFSALLERYPQDLVLLWLLNLAAMTTGDYPTKVPEPFRIPPETLESERALPRFPERAGELGLGTFSLAGGSILDDFDGDGYLDVIVSSWSPAGQLRYFHNQRDGTFSEQTEAAGLTGLYGGLNLLQADYDNDGDLDVLVLRGGWLGDLGRHPNSLLRNDGQGHFRDVTFPAGLGESHYPTQTASWADYDNDGDLDLYVGNENFPNQLFDNQGDGTFLERGQEAGVDDSGFSKGVIWGDYDNDRLPDLYVSNLEGDNRLYHNDGDGRFSEVAQKLGVTQPSQSFPVWFWDYNNDGALDLFVASFWQDVGAVAADYFGHPHNTELDCLYKGDGKGGFREVARELKLDRVTLPMGCNFGDLDNDGFLDFYLGTGYPEFEALMPNLMFLNDSGSGFLDVTSAGGFGHLQKGHGVSFGDLDNDGDQDILLEVGGWYAGDAYPNAVFENPGFGHHWLGLKLVGTKSNRSAIGARIKLELEGPSGTRSLYRWVNSGGSFGCNPLRQHLGLGKATRVKSLEITWPTSGETQKFSDIAGDQFLQITEGELEYATLPLAKLKLK